MKHCAVISWLCSNLSICITLYGVRTPISLRGGPPHTYQTCEGCRRQSKGIIFYGDSYTLSCKKCAESLIAQLHAVASAHGAVDLATASKLCTRKRFLLYVAKSVKNGDPNTQKVDSDMRCNWCIVEPAEKCTLSGVRLICRPCRDKVNEIMHQYNHATVRANLMRVFILVASGMVCKDVGRIIFRLITATMNAADLWSQLAETPSFYIR